MIYMRTLNSNHDMFKHNQRHELWSGPDHDRTSRGISIQYQKQYQNIYDIRIETKAIKGMTDARTQN